MYTDGIKIGISVTKENIVNVMKIMMEILPFKPTRMSAATTTDQRKFKEDIFWDSLDRALKNRHDSYSTHVRERMGSFAETLTMHFDEFSKSALIMLSSEKTIDVDYLISAVDKIAAEGLMISAWLRGYTDHEINNSSYPHNYEKQGIDVSKLRTYYDKWSKKDLIDKTQFSGHFNVTWKIHFTSCYLMWFGKDFFKFIPQEKLQGFTDCYKNETFENGTVRIQLYEDINDFRSEETDRRQWAFRKYADIDNVAEAWEEKYQALTRLDHSCANMEIEDGKFEHGGVKRVKTYLDANGKNTIKKLAVKVHITEYDSSGKKIFSETVKVVENENIKS